MPDIDLTRADWIIGGYAELAAADPRISISEAASRLGVGKNRLGATLAAAREAGDGRVPPPRRHRRSPDRCTGCRRPMVPSGNRADGHVTHRVHGLCTRCVRRQAGEPGAVPEELLTLRRPKNWSADLTAEAMALHAEDLADTGQVDLAWKMARRAAQIRQEAAR